MVEALQALRGVQFTVAITRVAELGDLTRFHPPSELMNYLGLTPSESSSGERRRQGAITKSGNTHARRVLVEGAWAYRYPAKVSRHWQLRLEKQPKVLQDISWKAQVRLCNPTTTFVVDLSDLSPYAAPVYHPFDQERAHVTSLSDRRRRICDSHF